MGQYTYLLTNNAQELTPKDLNFNCDTNRTRKYFLSVPRFEPGISEMNNEHISQLCQAATLKCCVDNIPNNLVEIMNLTGKCVFYMHNIFPSLAIFLVLLRPCSSLAMSQWFRTTGFV
jgi:hypothetical protein